MARTVFLVVSLVFALYFRGVLSALEACGTNDQADCDANEPNSICNTADDVCECEFTATEGTDTCDKKTCTLADIVATTCGSNTACEASPESYVCVCNANHEVTTTACAPKTCTDGSTVTADCGGSTFQCVSGICACPTGFVASGSTCKKSCAGSVACDSDATCVNDICQCNVNFEGNGDTCTARICSTTVTTACSPNSKCVSDACVCATGWEVDGTVCKKTCSADSGCTSSNGLCVSSKCECDVNYAGDGNTCAQKKCSGDDSSNCDANSKCSSNLCVCADDFVVSAMRCKRGCSSNATVCDSNAACVSDVCECNVNYQGGGGASGCAQLSCTGDDATTCHPNSQCVNSKCQCADDYEPSGTTCVACPTGWKSDGTVCKKTCTSDTDCGPTTAVCSSERCECATNHVGNGTTCAAKTCTANTECGTASNYTCTSGSCACASGYSFANTERDCIMNAGGIVFYSLSLMIAALLLSIFSNKM